MFITLSNVQHGVPISLNPALDNRDGEMEVALSEILYYPAWANVSEALGNNTIVYGDRVVTIPDGYWDVCALHKEIFTPLGLTLSHNPATGLISIGGVKKQLQLDRFGNTLGFRKSGLVSLDGQITAEAFPRLIVFKEIYIHLAGLSTYENRHNSWPSTLLRAIPIEKEECNGGRHLTFATPHFKRLETGTLSQIEVTTLTAEGAELKLAYLSLTLEVRSRENNGRS